MNLLARILSHGFALAMVVLIAIILMYRGELFPEWDLPEFLVVEGKPDATTGAASGSAERALPEAVVTRPEYTTDVTPEAPSAEIPREDSIQEEATPVVAPPAETPEVVAPPEEAPPVVPSPEETPPVVPSLEEVPLVVPPPEEAPQVTAPLEEVPLVVPPPEEAPTAEAPGVEATGAAMAQDEVSSVGKVVRDTVDESAETGAAATAARAESDKTVPQTLNVQGQTEAEPVAASAIVTATETVAGQPDSTLQEMTSSLPAASTTLLEGDTGKSAYELLAAAREAYWLRDYEGAENYYRSLIQLEPDNPDWYGELGNMYFAQGQWQQSAAVYYEAGVHLLKEGQVEQARRMVDVIRGLNGAEADDLENQINDSRIAP